MSIIAHKFYHIDDKSKNNDSSLRFWICKMGSIWATNINSYFLTILSVQASIRQGLE